MGNEIRGMECVNRINRSGHVDMKFTLVPDLLLFELDIYFVIIKDGIFG